VLLNERLARNVARLGAREPGINFGEGLEQTVEWYLENQDWVENVVTGEYQEYYQRVYGKD